MQTSEENFPKLKLKFKQLATNYYPNNPEPANGAAVELHQQQQQHHGDA